MDKKVQEDLIKKINSKIDKTIEEGIDAIRENGNAPLLKEIFAVFDQSSAPIQLKITSLFNDLKDQTAVETVIVLLKEKLSNASRMMLLSSCWQNRLDYIDHMELFIDMVMTEGFELSFEAFTVIENMESKVSKERKNELIGYVKNNIEKCNEANQVLSHDIVGIIEQYEEL